MSDLAREPIHADWSQLSYFLLTVSRSGGWSALAYMAGFDDTRGDSSYTNSYREVLFVAAHRWGLMRTHMLVLSQLWLTVPMAVDWYVGWRPAPAGAQTECPAQCFCPFQGRLWAESAAWYSLGMWTV